jgi:transposase
MAYRTGNRYQMAMLPESIEKFVAENDPVRAYDAFIEALDFDQLGIVINPYKVGNSEYHPKAMLKLLVYGPSYGVRSSRKLEQQTYHNMSFIWLMGGLKPDHKTISEFRRKNKKALKKVLKLSARMCIKLDLIAGNVLFVDGTKIRANASASQTHEKQWYEEKLEEIDRHINQLLKQCEAEDQKEAHLGSFVVMEKELSKAETLKIRIEDVLEDFSKTGKKKVNQTDPDCSTMRSVQGKHAGYNVQSVVDDENGLIVHAEAVNDSTDQNQFARQVEQAHEVLEKSCEVACADAGYADTEELEKIDEKDIKVIVPSQRQALHNAEGPFTKQHFIYDQDKDCYYCPEGHRLALKATEKKTVRKRYQITDKQLCFSCKHWGRCTNSKFCGRRIVRLPNEDTKQRLEAQYEQPESQEIYVRRKTRVEHPFGHLKHNLQVSGFLLRGRDGVEAETSLFFTCFNIARMITLLGGVTQLVEKIKAITPNPAW